MKARMEIDMIVNIQDNYPKKKQHFRISDFFESVNSKQCNQMMLEVFFPTKMETFHGLGSRSYWILDARMHG